MFADRGTSKIAARARVSLVVLGVLGGCGCRSTTPPVEVVGGARVDDPTDVPTAAPETGGAPKEADATAQEADLEVPVQTRMFHPLVYNTIRFEGRGLVVSAEGVARIERWAAELPELQRRAREDGLRMNVKIMVICRDNALARSRALKIEQMFLQRGLAMDVFAVARLSAPEREDIAYVREKLPEESCMVMGLWEKEVGWRSGGGRSEDGSRRISAEEAVAAAGSHLTSLAEGGGPPTSLRGPVKCRSNCISIDSGKTNISPCPSWECTIPFADPTNPLPRASVLVYLDGDARPVTAIDIEACLRHEHGCEIKTSRVSAMKRLRATRSSLRVVWDAEQTEFYWENTDTGKRLNCHGSAGR